VNRYGMRLMPELFTTPLTLSPRLVRELTDARGTLRAVTQRSDSTVIVRAGGEADAFNNRTWRRLIREAAAAATRPGSVVVDVNALDFMSCSAFVVLADEAERCRRRGVELRLVSLGPRVARIAYLGGFGKVLPVHPTVHSARFAPAAPG
jgi:anti-anti-sigma factor